MKLTYLLKIYNKWRFYAEEDAAKRLVEAGGYS